MTLSTRSRLGCPSWHRLLTMSNERASTKMKDSEEDATTPYVGLSTSTVVPSYPPSSQSGDAKDGEISQVPRKPASPPHPKSEDGDKMTLTQPSSPLSSTSQTLNGPPFTLPREIAFVAVLCTAQLFTQASLAQAIAPLHIIGASLGTSDASQLSWFPAAYSLTVGTFILIAGRLGDLYGHKRFFTTGFVWYGVWSLLAGFAVYVRPEPIIFFDVCRAMQGIGPAFLLPNALAIIARTYPPGRRKEMVFSLFGGTAPTGFAVGAVFSSLFAQLAWWPWAYWTMGIFCFLAAVAGIFAIPPMPVSAWPQDGSSIFARIDGLGCLTGVSALVLINFAFNQGPAAGWSTPYVYAMLILGLAVLGVFALVEARAAHPLLPRAALTRDTAFVLGCMAAGWASFGIWIFYLWEFLSRLRAVSPLLGSAMVAPVTVSGLAAALTSGLILHRAGPSVVMSIAMTAFTVGGVLMATAPVQQSYWAQTFVSVIVMPWGMDMSFPAATILLSDRMPREHQGVAASLVNTVINYAASIGLGLAGTVESQVRSGGGDLLMGIRGAYYMGIGLAGLGVCISVLFGGSQLRDRKKRSMKGEA